MVKMNYMSRAPRIQVTLWVIVAVFLSCSISVAFLSWSYEFDLDLRKIGDIIQEISKLDRELDNRSPRSDVPARVKQLLEATRGAARAANGGVDPPSLTQEEFLKWTAAHPCRSRVELPPMYARRNDVRDMAHNPLWDLVLEEYSKLHRICMAKIEANSSLRDSFLTKTTVPGCKFAVADVDIPVGLSNRILSVTSIVLYAILTQRVVLVPKSTLLTSLMCEPFPGSRWNLDSYSLYSFYPESGEGKRIWKHNGDMYDELDRKLAFPMSSLIYSPRSNLFAASMRHSQFHPDSRFFCDTEQASFAGITWLHFTGCIYTLPKFFAVPSFRRTLDALFPGRFVLTQTLRSVMLPSDMVWDKVVETEKAKFPKVDHTVGIQVRYYGGQNQYNEMNGIVNDRILTCGIDNGLFPSQTASAQLRNLTDGKSVHVFIVSLFKGLYDHMTKVYDQSSPENNVTVTQLTSNQLQGSGLDEDTQALVEIFLLSFSNSLLNTPVSTFGGMATGYGSLIPWQIQTQRIDGIAPCERATTMDVCYHTAELRYRCQYNPFVDGKLISDVVPYFQPCLVNFSQAGLRLTTDYSEVPLPKPLISDVQRGLDGTIEPPLPTSTSQR